MHARRGAWHSTPAKHCRGRMGWGNPWPKEGRHLCVILKMYPVDRDSDDKNRIQRVLFQCIISEFMDCTEEWWVEVIHGRGRDGIVVIPLTEIHMIKTELRGEFQGIISEFMDCVTSGEGMIRVKSGGLHVLPSLWGPIKGFYRLFIIQRSAVQKI